MKEANKRRLTTQERVWELAPIMSEGHIYKPPF